MMQLTDDLREKVQAAIEAKADPDALPNLRQALATVADPQHQDAIFAAAITLASTWADAALLVGGWQPTQARGCLPSRGKR